MQGAIFSGYPCAPLLSRGRCVDRARRKRIRIIAETEAAAIVWDHNPLVVATRLDKDNVHVRLDLRALGIHAFDDEKGLHVGSNTLCGNHVINCETEIGLA